MTREEAIKKIKWFREYNEDDFGGGDRIQDKFGDWYYLVTEQDLEAFDMAIKALEQEPTDKNFTKADIDAIVKAINVHWELIIDEIKAEIKDYFSITCDGNCDNCNRVVKNPCGESVDGAWVLHIFDKHRAESENT